MNGKHYRECEQNVIYCVTKPSLSSIQSLVDREANRGVARCDMRFIETHADRKVYIRGTDSHEITAIPLVTTGGLISATIGEVIVIMHQNECHSKNKTTTSSPQIKYYKNIVDDHCIKVGGV